MAPKIGPSVNLPTTDPLWELQRLEDDVAITPQEGKISNEQNVEVQKLRTSMNQPVQKGDWKGARARADSVEKQFEGLSPDNKKYMYEKLQTDNGLAKDFEYRFSTPTRDKLLKTLNPDHKEEHIAKYTMADAKEKAQKALEMNMQGNQRQKELEEFMKKKEAELNKRMEELSQ